ncbi:MAG: hypothetical protein R3D84_10240 [Paracoccaceae bacterium]
MIMVGFVLGWLAFRFAQPVAGNIVAVIAAVLVPIFWWIPDRPGC